MALGRDAILAADDLPREAVPVDEWGKGETVMVRAITALDFERFQLSIADYRDDPSKADNIRCRFLVCCLVDAAGQRLFGDDDARALGQKHPAPIARLYVKAQELSGLSANAVEDAAKN
jgi:hypothetical protein